MLEDYTALAEPQGIDVVAKEHTFAGITLRPYSEGERVLIAERRLTSARAFIWTVLYVLATPRQVVRAAILQPGGIDVEVLAFADLHESAFDDGEKVALRIIGEAKVEEVEAISPKG